MFNLSNDTIISFIHEIVRIIHRLKNVEDHLSGEDKQELIKLEQDLMNLRQNVLANIEENKNE